ncbi:MAG: hypothetical protein WAO83_00190 [Fuerstiella sp.]
MLVLFHHPELHKFEAQQKSSTNSKHAAHRRTRQNRLLILAKQLADNNRSTAGNVSQPYVSEISGSKIKWIGHVTNLHMTAVVSISTLRQQKVKTSNARHQTKWWWSGFRFFGRVG